MTYLIHHRDATAFWVIRDCDDVRFALAETKHDAEQATDRYEQESDEEFRVAPEHRSAIPYWELPESWEHDWVSRIPNGVQITAIPVFAADAAGMLDQIRPRTDIPAVQEIPEPMTVHELQENLRDVVEQAVDQITSDGIPVDDWSVETVPEDTGENADELWAFIWIADNDTNAVDDDRSQAMRILREALDDADTGLPQVVNANYDTDVGETGIACWWAV